jgi:hypothetical protein
MLESVETFINNEVGDGGSDGDGDGYTDDDDYEDSWRQQDEESEAPSDDSNRDEDEDEEDEEEDSSRGAHAHRESWQSTRSLSPTTAAIRNSSGSSSSSSGGTAAAATKTSSSQPYTESSARLAAIFSPERSSQAKALVVAVKTVTASFKCISEEELEYIANTRHEVLHTRNKYQALVHDHQRISQEIEVR